MASNGQKHSGTTENGGDVSAGRNPKQTVDLNATEQDRAAAPDGGSIGAEEKKDGEVLKVTSATVGCALGYDAPINDRQKKIRRAERFGMPVQLSEEEKRNSRAERFGTATALKESESSKKSEELKRKARAERFGLPVSFEPVNEEAKKKARLTRFGADAKPDSVEEEKRKDRGLRFSKPTSDSSSQVPANENISQEAVVAEKAD